MRKTTKWVVVIAALALGAACGKGSSGGDAATGGDGAPAPVGATPAAGEVATYPDTIPQGGTKITRVSFTVKQAADENSATLTRIGPGTAINLKGSHSSWMLIEWPSGVGQMSPGWINLDLHDTTKLSDTPVDAGVTKDAAVVVDAAPDVAVKDAGGKDASRPVIVIKPKTPKPG